VKPFNTIIDPFSLKKWAEEMEDVVVKQIYEYCGHPRKRETASIHSLVIPDASNVGKGTSTIIQRCLKQQYLNIHPLQEQYLGFTVHTALNSLGVCVIDNFLKAQPAKQLNTLVKSLSSSHGLLHDPLNVPITVGEGQTLDRARYRDDYITWLSGNKTEYHCVEILTECIYKIIKLFYQYSLSQKERHCITHKSMVQLSCFPLHSMGYQIHSDNPNNNGRFLSLVYHCNEEYDCKTDGGSTRFYLNDKFVDVHPNYNRLVMYWSTNLLEILPCKRSLCSLSTWYFGNIIKNEENMDWQQPVCQQQQQQQQQQQKQQYLSFQSL